MPLYEYRCDACGHRFEKIQRFSDDPISVCPSCGGGPVEKLLSSPAIQFKGSGWYITDYARAGGGSGKESSKSESTSSESTSESKSESKSDTKTDTKTETKSDSKPKASGSDKKGKQAAAA